MKCFCDVWTAQNLIFRGAEVGVSGGGLGTVLREKYFEKILVQKFLVRKSVYIFSYYIISYISGTRRRMVAVGWMKVRQGNDTDNDWIRYVTTSWRNDRPTNHLSPLNWVGRGGGGLGSNWMERGGGVEQEGGRVDNQSPSTDAVSCFAINLSSVGILHSLQGLLHPPDF